MRVATPAKSIVLIFVLAELFTSATLFASGRKISDVYSAAGRLTNMTFASYGGQSVNYTYFNATPGTGSTAAYWPSGALHLDGLGNGTSEAFNLSPRLQQTSSLVGAPGGWSVNSVNRWLSKTYSLYDCSGNNNGNVMSIADTLNAARNQTFGYDGLNRLTSGSEADGAFTETFSYDPWGNMQQAGTWNFQQAFTANNQISGAPVNCTSANVYCYDASGNLLNDGFHTYAYDIESRIKTVDTNGAAYTYGPEGERVRKDTAGAFTEYVYFGGQVIAEKNSAGDWTDYVFAGGRRLAKAEALDNGLRSYGVKNASGQWAINYFGNLGGLANYTIQTGDKLYLTQYQLTGSKGGVVLNFADGSSSNWSVKDKEGYYLNDDQTQANTHFRTIDLSTLAGKVISKVGVNQETDTTNGSWAMIYEQMSLVSSDGTVHPLYTGETASPIASSLQSGGETGIGAHIDTNRGKAIYPTQTTTYYAGDHLGSARIITSGNGYPVWQGTFAPFGQEWNPQITANHYKFTGKERDTESGLDFFGARFYAPSQGRWLSPDWADKPQPVPYADLSDPQSLNLYSYVRNDPMSHADADGHVVGVDDAIVLTTIGIIALDAYVSSPLGQQTIKNGFTAINAALDNVAGSIRGGINSLLQRSGGGASEQGHGAQGSNSEKKNSGGEPPQLKAGKEAHKNEEVRPGEKAEVRTPSGAGRMDRYDEEKGHIREIKPDNERGEQTGQQQLDRYKQEMDKATGRPHTTELTKYPKSQ